MNRDAQLLAVAGGLLLVYLAGRKVTDTGAKVVEVAENTYWGARLSLADFFSWASGTTAEQERIMSDPDYAALVRQFD